MKRCLAIRAMDPRLYNLSLEFSKPLLDSGFEKRLLFNTTAENYLFHLLHLGFDWVVSTDEDVFIWDCDAVTRIIEYMNREGYICAGVSEGVRGMNPVVVNPFFMILNVGALRKNDTFSHIMKTEPDERMLNLVPERFKTGKVLNHEGFYRFFYWVLKQGPMLYLDSKRLEEGDLAMVVQDTEGSEFMLHCWWGRLFEKQRARFDKLIKYAKGRKGGN